MSFLKGLQEMAENEIPAAPIAELLGFDILKVSEGSVTIGLEVTEKLHNPMGTLHGGVLGDIADAAMGYAFSTTLRDDQLFTTVDMKINFLKPVYDGKLEAVSRIIKRGSKIGLLECSITDESGSLVAHSTSTCMVLEGQKGLKRERRDK